MRRDRGRRCGRVSPPNDRGIDLGGSEALGVLDGEILRAPITVMDQLVATILFSLPDGLIEGIEHELGAH